MSDSFDQAGALDAAPLPVASSSRRFVFTPNPEPDPAMQEAWVRWAGASEFVSDPALAIKCGMSIFRADSLGEFARLVRPFFERHGKEANVFEFSPVWKNFRVIDSDWLHAVYGW